MGTHVEKSGTKIEGVTAIGCIGKSGQYVSEYVAVDVRQAALDAVVVVREPVVPDAEQVQRGGVEIVPGDRLVDDLPADVI